MGIDNYLDCPVCGESIPEEIEGRTVRYCPFCGEELELADIIENGADDPNMYDHD